LDYGNAEIFYFGMKKIMNWLWTYEELEKLSGHHDALVRGWGETGYRGAGETGMKGCAGRTNLKDNIYTANTLFQP
jgi:hypothetical protein